MEERDKLPFRINCEGYFIKEGKILAKDSGKGFIMFPGGGVDNGEDLHSAMTRETKEETGILPKNLKHLGVLKIVWGPDWAKTDKQKMRYQQFQGDEMHFFEGFAGGEMSISKEEDAWNGRKFLRLLDVINILEKSRPFDESVKEYRETQLRFLRALLKRSQS